LLREISAFYFSRWSSGSLSPFDFAPAERRGSSGGSYERFTDKRTAFSATGSER
jgi:hypothetical protein